KSLAVGIANICYVINPEVVILGGGIMAQEKFLKPKIDKALKEVLIERVYKNTNIEFAKRQNDAGMLGALYNFLNKI
ncbi:ROK family protein, partial [Clostridioides difficile]